MLMDMKAYQIRVSAWLMKCFGLKIADDKKERTFRFLEEAIELAQSMGCSETEAQTLIKYVYSRPVGDPSQEVGGVMVTLAALCYATDISLEGAASIELHRIEQPEIIEKIRAKQVSKDLAMVTSADSRKERQDDNRS